MDKKRDEFEKHIEKIDMSDVLPTCDNIHPLVREYMFELLRSPEMDNLFDDQLTDFEGQLRDCLSTEIETLLEQKLPKENWEAIEPYLRSITQFTIAAAWLMKMKIGPQFGEGK